MEKRDYQRKDDLQLALLQKDVCYIKEKVEHINNKLEEHYVTIEEFTPIKKLAYGLLYAVLVGFATLLGTVMIAVIKGGLL